MRGLFNVAGRSFLAAVAAFFIATAFAPAGHADQGARRIILTPNADYPGGDMSTLKNVDLPACQAACLKDTSCKAFTFNTKANWCFLKSDFAALAASPNATAGRVVTTADLTPTLEHRRLADLSFLAQAQIDEARAEIGDLKDRYTPGMDTYAALRKAGGVAYHGSEFDDAADDFGKALAIANEDVNAWLDYATASGQRNPDSDDDKQQAAVDTSAAAINAYLRADSAGDRAEALAILGDGLAKREIWLPAIRAYRASLALKKDATIQATYDKAVAEHGFRVDTTDVEADSAAPQVCVKFTDALPVTRADLADFVTVEGGTGLAIEPQKQQICINGVQHGARYTIRLRGELPAADGETLGHPVELTAYVRDRAPWVGFAGNAYVLPAGPGASIPLTSVNTDKAKAAIYRIGDRALADAVKNGNFLSQLSTYSAEDIANTSGEKVWEGTVAIQSKLNETETTAIPVAAALPSLKPGAYVITAVPANAADNDTGGAIATQWFIVSDFGLTALSGTDGIHTSVRSLSTAKPVAGVTVRLVAVNNEVLGEATTDADGNAAFEPGLARGTGGLSPQLVVAETGTDYAFIDLTRAAFDLTDRGVAGRTTPEKLDVFLTPERGIYRPGETVHLTALVRDDRANAVGDLPMTLVVERPDGVEFLRKTLSDGGAGGYSADVALDANAQRGSWTAKLYADPKGNAVAEQSILVEDFEPERLAVTIDTPSPVLDRIKPTTVNLEARYLYGASAPDLPIEGEVKLTPTDTLDAFPGYKFGLSEESIEPTRLPLSLDASTDQDGKASFDVTLPEVPASTKPFTASLILRVDDTNGRAVERTLTRPVAASGAAIGIHPEFDGGLAEGSPAQFDAILVGPDGKRIAKPGLTWKLERVDSDYQWYRSNGTWSYEVVTSTSKVDGGTVDFSADAPAKVTANNINWGDYRFTIEDGSETATSVEFYAGWYQATASSTTPDTLKVALDKPAYKIGDTAQLRLDPRFAGTAVIQVMDDRLIAMKTVDVPAEGTTVDLEITDAWGPGAYVTATLYRPMDLAAKRMPARALGLAWAKVAPGDRQLAVSLGVADDMRPRQKMTIPVAIGNLKAGEDAYVTVAAVDVGILNLTSFQAPAPDDWYFGQRKLGMEIRDIYGLLIDRMQGVPGDVRSGGDSGAVRLKAPPPTQKLLAYYSGIVKVDDSGKATVSFDVPDFNGSVRVMAMAWTKDGVGHASKDVTVHDPVVVTASIPRFLGTEDTSRLLVEINNVSGPAGDYTLAVTAGDGIGIAATDASRTLTLAEKQRVAFNVPITGTRPGDFDIKVALTAPSGESYPTTLTLGVRPPGAPVTHTTDVPVAAGGTLTLDKELLADFVPGTTSVSVSLGGAGPLDVPGILSALDRYPYGCVEQLSSRAMPLVYLDDVASTIGIAADAEVRKRVQKAIQGVLADQAASGSFGLWGPEGAGSDLWLDAYVTDFLTRASEKGYDVPDVARTIALDNLSNAIASAADFDHGGEQIAYALYVLARSGRAAIGDLRYYTDSKLADFATPLAKAQVGAAMALYGDRERAAKAFSAAMADLDKATDQTVWRHDYGTVLRDGAGVLTLAAETRSEAVDLRTLATRIATAERKKRYTSTQENSWMLLAAAALIKDSAKAEFTLDGQQIAAPIFRRFAGDRIEQNPVAITNLGSDPLDAVVSASGVPTKPEPAGGTGFRIERAYYMPDGTAADVATVKQNDRFVVVLHVVSDHSYGGHIMIVDPIPAGFEIENPDISASGDTGAYSWLKTDPTTHTEARTDRFVAALDRDDGDPLDYSVAYSVRAVSPGVFAEPAATVEDMYQPQLNAHTDAGKIEVVGPTK